MAEAGTTPLVLHGYFRSTASYRVRIALALKGLTFEAVSHHLRRGEQRAPGFLALNPQGLVPALETAAGVLTQSLAICEYLDETYPEPRLLPTDSWQRAKVRAAAQVIACDIHPVQNLKVLDRLRAGGFDEAQVNAWAQVTIAEGLDAFVQLLPDVSASFCFGEEPSLADLCMVPQLVNARRFGVADVPERLLMIERNCLTLPAFRQAAPEAQPDAE